MSKMSQVHKHVYTLHPPYYSIIDGWNPWAGCHLLPISYISLWFSLFGTQTMSVGSGNDERNIHIGIRMGSQHIP